MPGLEIMEELLWKAALFNRNLVPVSLASVSWHFIWHALFCLSWTVCNIAGTLNHYKRDPKQPQLNSHQLARQSPFQASVSGHFDIHFFVLFFRVLKTSTIIIIINKYGYRNISLLKTCIMHYPCAVANACLGHFYNIYFISVVWHGGNQPCWCCRLAYCSG